MIVKFPRRKLVTRFEQLVQSATQRNSWLLSSIDMVYYMDKQQLFKLKIW